MFKCPDCGNTEVRTERRPDGDSFCPACSYRGPTSSFVDKESIPPPLPAMTQDQWIELYASELKSKIEKDLGNYLQNYCLDQAVSLVLESVRNWAEEF